MKKKKAPPKIEKSPQFFGNVNDSAKVPLPNLYAEDAKTMESIKLENEICGDTILHIPPFMQEHNFKFQQNERNSETYIKEMELKISSYESLLQEKDQKLKKLQEIINDLETYKTALREKDSQLEKLQEKMNDLEHYKTAFLDFTNQLAKQKEKFEESHIINNACGNFSHKLAFELSIEAKELPNGNLYPRLKYVENLKVGDALYSGPIDENNQLKGPGCIDFQKPNRKQISLFENGQIKNDLAMLIDEESNTYYFGKIVNGICENKTLIIPYNPTNSSSIGDLQYYGETKNNKKDGIGIIQLEAGKFYEGQWKNDIKKGIGKLWYKNFLYEGEIVNGVRQGKGKTTYESRNYHEGEYVNDLKHGAGKYCEINTDGTLKEIQEGKWENDSKEGQFTIINFVNQKSFRNYINNHPA